MVNIDAGTDVVDVKRCHAFISPDLDEETFVKDYYDSANLLKDASCDTTLKTLKELSKIQPNGFRTLLWLGLQQ